MADGKPKIIKSHRCCSVPQCNSRLFGNISLHYFPTDLKIRKEWVRVLRIGKAVTNHMQVCSLHFEKMDYYLPGVPTKRKSLKKTSIPSKKLPTQTHNTVLTTVELSREEFGAQRDMTRQNAIATPALSSMECATVLPKQKVQSKRYCCVPQCKSKDMGDRMFSFHLFPKEGEVVIRHNAFGIKEKQDRRKTWIHVLSIVKEVTKSMHVCSLHFVMNDYFYKGTRGMKRLLKTAVPSANLPTLTTASTLTSSGPKDALTRCRKRPLNHVEVVMVTPDINEADAATNDDITSEQDLFYASVKVENDIDEPSLPTFTNVQLKQEPVDYYDVSADSQLEEVEMFVLPVEQVIVNSLKVKTEPDEEVCGWQENILEVDPLLLTELKKEINGEQDIG